MNRTLLISTCLVCLAAGWWLGTLSRHAQSVAGIDPAGPLPRKLAAFELSDFDSLPFRLDDLRGHWTLIYLGYTSCPDVCPITLQELAQLNRNSDSLALEHPLQYLFVSVDPARDSPERLREYLGFFDADIIGASASSVDLARFAQQLDMVYLPVDDVTVDNYIVEHSADLAIVNPHAELHARFEAPHFAGVLQSRMISIAEEFSGKNQAPE